MDKYVKEWVIANRSFTDEEFRARKGQHLYMSRGKAMEYERLGYVFRSPQSRVNAASLGYKVVGPQEIKVVAPQELKHEDELSASSAVENFKFKKRGRKKKVAE